LGWRVVAEVLKETVVSTGYKKIMDTGGFFQDFIITSHNYRTL
jgi:hypothetical protein